MCGWRGRRFISDGKVGGGVLREGFEVVGGVEVAGGGVFVPEYVRLGFGCGEAEKVGFGKAGSGMMTVGEKRVLGGN